MSNDNPYSAARANYQNQFDMTRPQIPDYLVWSILETLCCCVPLGIVAIVFSVKANSAKQQGDYQTAMECANKAKMYLWIGFGFGLLVIILNIVIQIAGVSNGVPVQP